MIRKHTWPFGSVANDLKKKTTTLEVPKSIPNLMP